ncbi:MAG: twin-arginine translocation signal domain-containing protein [Scytonema sp. PMC 1069.18]|nr:twin-arginine translocation signal domain-containing protein [Scytonema sp. PMC 1069.18]MEC4884467.1 twin-arginine translocation signal domain-containing protein [Scytonema sp. PMC 1070.18]
MKKINRRQFITRTAAGAVSTVAASWIWERVNSSQLSTKPAINLPKLHKSTDGLLELLIIFKLLVAMASLNPTPLGKIQF